ncbi:MAG: hypothetical protein ACFCU3_05880 [Verrucomicrobiales bacterium]
MRSGIARFFLFAAVALVTGAASSTLTALHILSAQRAAATEYLETVREQGSELEFGLALEVRKVMYLTYESKQAIRFGLLMGTIGLVFGAIGFFLGQSSRASR